MFQSKCQYRKTYGNDIAGKCVCVELSAFLKIFLVFCFSKNVSSLQSFFSYSAVCFMINSHAFQINGVKYNGGVSRDSFDVIFKGSNAIVKNRCGMEAMFNGDNTVKVFVPQEYLSVRSGICGDCNGVQDDYKMKNETDVSSFENKYSLIGQSYYVPLPEDDIAE